MNYNKLIRNLIDKSIEAFIMGLEIYNKPTIKYRIEGFSFFICNAWELMLKAHLLNLGKDIYYKDDTTRTISLSDTVKKVYTDRKTRIRLNLERIIDLRNTSTHFITQEYEIKYAPLFQACVINYTKELNRFHNEDITTHISQNFLTLSASIENITNNEIKIKYPSEIAEKFIQKANELEVLTKEINSDNFSINISQKLYITKNKNDADFSVKIEKGSPNSITIAKEFKDPSNTHKYSYNNVITAVQERMNKNNLKIDNPKGFTSRILTTFIDFYSIKSDIKYSYLHKIGNQNQYTYSEELVNFIIECIKKKPEKFVESLKNT